MNAIAWDQVYATKQMAAYPDNALIRFVAKHYYGEPDRSAVQFLDVGCGFGASTWYLAREGFDVDGIDVSGTALQRLDDRLKAERLEAGLYCRDLVTMDIKAARYDCIVDVSSLCYVPAERIGGTMRRLHTALRPGGAMFSITPAQDCAPELFETFAAGINLKARFQTMEEAAANFAPFSKAEVGAYSYPASGKQAKLWVIEAEK